MMWVQSQKKRKRLKTREDVNANVEKTEDNGSEGSDTTFSQTRRRRRQLPSIKINHPDSDTVKSGPESDAAATTVS